MAGKPNGDASAHSGGNADDISTLQEGGGKVIVKASLSPLLTSIGGSTRGGGSGDTVGRPSQRKLSRKAPTHARHLPGSSETDNGRSTPPSRIPPPIASAVHGCVPTDIHSSLGNLPPTNVNVNNTHVWHVFRQPPDDAPRQISRGKEASR